MAATGHRRRWHLPKIGTHQGPLLLLLGIAIGVLTGLGAVLFHYLIAIIHNLALLQQFSFHRSLGTHTPPSPWGWALPLVPALGGLVVIFLARHYTSAVQGPGVSQVIEAVYRDGGRIRRNLAVLRPLATAITIGTGGSVGLEGPVMQFGAALASWLERLIPLSDYRRVHLLGCGVGAGVAAFFNAPLGGWLLAMEVILPDWRPWTILSTLFATIAASRTSQFFLGDFYLLRSIPVVSVGHGFQLSLFAGLGIVAALAAMVFIVTLNAVTTYSEKVFGNPYLRLALGMFLVGLLLLLTLHCTGHYYLIGGSYVGTDEILRGQIGTIGLLLLLLILKLLATSLTIGSGGSGGIFSPSLFIGAGTGALYGQLLLSCHLIPPDLLGLLALCGMAGIVAASTGALLSAPVMVVELTGNYGALLPAILTAVTAFAIRRMFLKGSIWTIPLRRHGLDIPENHYALEAREPEH
ncbi:chloride channel protein [Acidithiobacillus sp. M4-SHS-6]|uniref:chloride channel protein n=1 Tax=Acidithiobacillus sp. M4-SHS-6 TaxID=3383024 RepID=UPI0039BE7FD2